tara:strand:- start:132 stop:458 length:327 start_codon:yes stop_codon:yes gene_type:complete
VLTVQIKKHNIVTYSKGNIMVKRVYRFEYDGYIKDCPKCGGVFESGFYVPQKTKTLKCPSCNHKGDWDDFGDQMKFDCRQIEDRFYQKKSEYMGRKELENFDKWLESF